MKRSSDCLRTAIRAALGSLTAVAGTAAPLHAVAQEPGGSSEVQPVVEEVVVVGRFLSATEQLVNERLDDANVSDVLGAESISRLGDSTVADALRRMPGLTLVADKFVYIRGLGERYSTATLNGAQIPSPDLTRNVIPLDVFPTSIVDSLRVQKAWSANLPANFGGGLMEIRTKGIPDGLELNFEIGSGYNTENTGSGFTYPGGSDDSLGTDDGTRALTAAVLTGVNDYQGTLDTQNILSFLRRQDVSTTLADAQAVNRAFALELNRGAVVESKSMPTDVDTKISVGNTFDLNENWDLGILAGVSYATDWRQSTTLQRNFVFPEERTDTRSETTQSVNMSGNLNLGVNFTEDHEIALTHLWLRNTDDETEIRDYFNENREKSSGLGFRDYRFEFEERELTVDQIRGTHYLGDATRDILPRITSVLNWLPMETRFDWFVSESEATTDIPNRVLIQSQTNTDPGTGAVLSESVRLSNTAADHRFTDLKDQVRNNGLSLTIPIERDNSRLELSGGFESAQKARTYQQLQFSIGPLSVADPATLMLPLNEVFSDSNILDSANNFVFDRQGTNNESYLAATTTDSAWGNIDWTFNETWRLAIGARWEDYRQVGLDWDPLGFTQASPQITQDVDVLTRSVFASDEVYPAASFTYMSSFWAPTFQLRLGLSKTAVRPDLREITDASYVDPITDILTRGNSGVVPSDVDNVDIRAEWFFDSGDNFTVTLFSKDITNPIEFFATAASDTTVARQILNAESGYVRGIEIEGMKRLGFIGPVFDTLFVQGNVTFQDSELTVGDAVSGRVQPTNLVRSLAGASDYVLNLAIGYDSRNAKHTATMAYNMFSERLFTAGRNGQPDAFEQPFTSLDLTYSWYPTDKLALKVKLQNLLRDTVQIEQQGVLVFDEDPGSTYKVAIQWNF